MELVVRFKHDTWENALETGKDELLLLLLLFYLF